MMETAGGLATLGPLAHVTLQVWHRIVLALTTVPGAKDIGLTVVVFCGYGVLALAVGFVSGFLRWHVHTHRRLQIVVQTFFAPALLEELVFRGVLLPHPQELATLGNVWLWSGLSLCLFVVYHPINGLTFYKPGYFIFRQPVFLALAAWLGVVCTVLYRVTSSLWPSVGVHWFVVMIWIGYLGGAEQLKIPAGIEDN